METLLVVFVAVVSSLVTGLLDWFLFKNKRTRKEHSYNVQINQMKSQIGMLQANLRAQTAELNRLREMCDGCWKRN